MSDDLTAFLRARLDEQAEVASQWPAALDPPPQGATFWRDYNGHPIHEPRDRVLAEVDANRRILDHLDLWVDDGSDAVERLLALPYAQHPDYRQEWAP